MIFSIWLRKWIYVLDNITEEVTNSSADQFKQIEMLLKGIIWFYF